MKSRMAGIVAACASIALGGCASMSGDECAMSDWSAVGYEDGARGYTTDRFSTYRKACSKHGVAPDFQAYLQGRDQGLVEYCQPGRGFHLGSRGAAYGGVCGAELEPEFLDAYNAGYQLYELRVNVNSANSRVSAKERELEENFAEIRNKEAALISQDATTEERVLVLADLKRLSERNGELEAEIEMLIAERALYQQELELYERSVAARGY